MLEVLGSSHRGFCDGIARRTFLKIGGLAMSGLTLPQLLRAEARSGTTSAHKSIILIFLSGGPPQ
jgi:hypothetical protein